MSNYVLGELRPYCDSDCGSMSVDHHIFFHSVCVAIASSDDFEYHIQMMFHSNTGKHSPAPVLTINLAIDGSINEDTSPVAFSLFQLSSKVLCDLGPAEFQKMMSGGEVFAFWQRLGNPMLHITLPKKSQCYR